MNIQTFFSNLINTLLDGSLERVRIINQMNRAFKEYFLSGEYSRLCKVSISAGQSEYAHEMSTMWLRSGFKVTIENDQSLKPSEVEEIAKTITGNETFVRQLMAMGFDTLIVRGKNQASANHYALKNYANLSQYFIGR